MNCCNLFYNKFKKIIYFIQNININNKKKPILKKLTPNKNNFHRF